MYSGRQYVKYETICTVQDNMYSTRKYVQYKTLCTVEGNMYSTRKYIQYKIIYTVKPRSVHNLMLFYVRWQLYGIRKEFVQEGNRLAAKEF